MRDSVAKSSVAKSRCSHPSTPLAHTRAYATFTPVISSVRTLHDATTIGSKSEKRLEWRLGGACAC